MSDKESSTALEDQIFGSSSSEDEGAYDSSSEGYNVGITTTRRKGRSSRKPKAKKGGGRVSERVLEARRDFDEALEKIKSQGNRRRTAQIDSTDPINLDELASSFRRRMFTAVERDNEDLEHGKPALAKHKMLTEVVEMLNRKHMHEVLLDCGILSAVRMWMEPLPNRSLPAPHLRKTLLELVRGLPVETDHLRESGVGRIVMFFAQRSKESPDIQRLARELISRWSRPIIGDRRPLATPTSDMDTPDTSGQVPPVIQSAAYRELSDRQLEGTTGLSSQHKKLALHMQKKARSGKKTI